MVLMCPKQNCNYEKAISSMIMMLQDQETHDFILDASVTPLSLDYISEIQKRLR